ncbi:MAG: hypothetical protein EXR79_03465 [Myxococcales bacterium]|nr:hypothetical protein [Myxococcales bacterium]
MRLRLTPAVAVLCAALVGTAGCKKKEEEKKPEAAAAGSGTAAPAEPAMAAAPAAASIAPDIELAAGEGVAGWISLQSIGGLFDAIDAIGGKVGAVPPGASLRDGAYGQMATMLAVAGVTGHEWLDKTKPVHVAFQDEAPAAPAAVPAPAPAAAPGQPPVVAAPAPFDPQAGVALIVHVTDKAKALAAMPGAKKGADAEGHDASITVEGKTAYLDFVGDTTLVLTADKGRFAKVKTFVERLDKVEVPALAWIGVSVEDVAKTRAAEIESFIKSITDMGKMMPANPGMPNQAAIMAMYTQMLRKWATELTRVEMLIGADVNATKLEVRLHAKDGTSLHRQMMAARGRTSRDIAGLLPGNTYAAMSGNIDPQPGIETIDEAILMLKDLLKLEPKDWDAFVVDVKGGMKLQDGQSAIGLYPDGAAALGLLMAVGTTDGETLLRVTKKVTAGILLKLIEQQKVAKAMAPDSPDAKMLAIVEQALRDQKLDPVLQAFGPLAKEKGVTLTVNTVKDGEVSCDVLDVGIDWTKMPDPDAANAKVVVGDKTALALCSAKSKVSFAIGPGALEHGKRAALGAAGGLNDAPIYKATTASAAGAAWLGYLNPGMGLAAFKALGPQVPQVSGDKAALFACQSRAKSFGCGLEVPVDLIVAIKNAAMPAPAAMAPPPAMPPTPGPTGAPIAP